LTYFLEDQAVHDRPFHLFALFDNFARRKKQAKEQETEFFLVLCTSLFIQPAENAFSLSFSPSKLSRTLTLRMTNQLKSTE